jgi:hypothetical protein
MSAVGSDVGAVLKEHPSWSNIVNCTDDFPIQTGSLSGDPAALAGTGDVLTREASADRITPSQLCSEVHGSNIGLDDS